MLLNTFPPRPVLCELGEFFIGCVKNALCSCTNQKIVVTLQAETELHVAPQKPLDLMQLKQKLNKS